MSLKQVCYTAHSKCATWTRSDSIIAGNRDMGAGARSLRQ